jgi:3-hydroxyacyl-CoA dehydrogenase
VIKFALQRKTYVGLVELGVGLIPGGGGTKEFALRASDEMHEDEPETITLKNRFLTIATAKVATSAMEALIWVSTGKGWMKL